MSGDSKLPGSANAFSFCFFATPCVVGEALRFAQEERVVHGIAGKEEGTSGMVEVFEFIEHGVIYGLGCVGFERCFTFKTSVFMEMPPDNLAVGHYYTSGRQIGEGSIVGILDVSQHPVHGLLLFGVELGYRLGETEIEDDGVAFLFDGYRIGRRSGAVGDGEVHRVGEVTRNTCSRRKGCSLGGLNRRDECFEIRSNRHCYVDGTRQMVRATWSMIPI